MSLQIKLVNINASDIVDGRPPVILGLIWTIILYFQVNHKITFLLCTHIFSTFICIHFHDSFIIFSWTFSEEASKPLIDGILGKNAGSEVSTCFKSSTFSLKLFYSVCEISQCLISPVLKHNAQMTLLMSSTSIISCEILIIFTRNFWPRENKLAVLRMGKLLLFLAKQNDKYDIIQT